MTKICHITSVHNQKDVRIFEKECISLAQSGYEVHLVAPGMNGIEKNVQIHGIGMRPVSRMKRMLFFSYKAYKKVLDIDAEIYHFHDPELIPYGLLLKKKNKKVIFDSHENVQKQFIEKEYIPIVLRKCLDGIFARYINHACRKFDAIISVDPILCDQYRKINSNTVMVANFPRVTNLKENVQKERYICFVGGISAQWNHDVIINAINEIDDCSYVLCGNADKNYLEYLKTLPGWQKVDYKGQVSHEMALELLQSSCAGVALCSYSRNTNGSIGTLGNTKLFEIMMCKVPVICTNFKLWTEIVEKNACGYCVDFRNQAEVRKKIQEILESDENSERLGEAGRKAVKEIYNWGKETVKLKKLYSELIRESVRDR